MASQRCRARSRVRGGERGSDVKKTSGSPNLPFNHEIKLILNFNPLLFQYYTSIKSVNHCLAECLSWLVLLSVRLGGAVGVRDSFED